MLYIFAGFPGKWLPPGSKHIHAGGLRHTIEVENLGLLQEDNFIQVRKDGVFSVTAGGEERLSKVQFHPSTTLLSKGIDWRWFPENYSFGNGVTLIKTTANRETQLVDHTTRLTFAQAMALRGRVRLADLDMEEVYKLTEGWEKYEARWIPGFCPQENHIVHLTTCCFRHELPLHAYSRLQELIEVPGTELRYPELYNEQHFSIIRTWRAAEEHKPSLAVRDFEKLLRGGR